MASSSRPLPDSNSPRSLSSSLSIDLDTLLEEHLSAYRSILNCARPEIVAQVFQPPQRRLIHRDRKGSHRRLMKDYFDENCTYTPEQFHKRFRMRRELFLRILNDVKVYDDFFVQKRDATGRLGLSSIQKMTSAIRILAYGCSADSTDEYIKINESIAIQCLMAFCNAVVAVYEAEYMREPNEADIARLLQEGEARGFPGMLGSIDCMHWEWKNCPVAWHGTHKGRSHKDTLILEAVASQDLWIWHAFFGMPGSHNDLNVLDHSSVFNSIVNGRQPPVNYVVNGHHYTMGYYLSDGIYPKWATLMQTIPNPKTAKQKVFAERQEACRKDVERAFGVLQIKWAITQGPVRYWDKMDLSLIMRTCIILHNMIIEDERHTNTEIWQPPEEMIPNPIERLDPNVCAAHIYARQLQYRSKETNTQLRKDLIEHLWNRIGDEDEDN